MRLCYALCVETFLVESKNRQMMKVSIFLFENKIWHNVETLHVKYFV
jgi:hypothetical protein